MTTKDKQLSAALHEYFSMGLEEEYKRAQKAAVHASWCVHFGPENTGKADKRYCAALNRVKRFIDANMSDYWIDLDCDYGVSDREPEGENVDGEWIEPFTENTYHIKKKEAAKLLFGVCTEYL